MHRRRSALLACALAVTAGLLAGCGTSPAATAGQAGSLGLLQPGTLIIGTDFTSKPFDYYADGQPAGFDVALMKQVAAYLHLKPTWVNASYSTLYTSLVAGKFDVVAANAGMNAARERIVDFSRVYFISRGALAINAGKTPQITGISKVTPGMAIGVESGSASVQWADKNLAPRGVVVKIYQDYPAAFTDLETGRIQGVLDAEAGIHQIAAGRPDIRIAGYVDYAGTAQNAGIVVRKDHPALLNAINAALTKLMANGTYKAIYEQYFPYLSLPSFAR
jgi:ABC-type amino acid transport substrate-binding protein